MFTKIVLLAVGLGLIAITNSDYIVEEIGAYHFHTYFFEPSESSVSEAIALRKKVRELINDGTFPDCSINQIHLGFHGPHPVANYEVCCNKTSFAIAKSFFVQNHGNLSVLTHPLTVYLREDHEGRADWLGKPVPLYTEFMREVIPTPIVCPVYPDYPDEIPESNNAERFAIIPGTEEFEYYMQQEGKH